MPTGLSNAISGLSNFQRLIDIVGNNISNLNTPGFKSANVSFKEIMSQTLRGASNATSDRGGTNPMQIGLGTSMAAIEQTLTQGPIEVTGKVTDLAITGSGYFIVRGSSGYRYSRSGNFSIDSSGDLVESTGSKVMGWRADPATGVVTPSGQVANLQSLNVPLGQAVKAKATTNINFSGNLNAAAANASTYTTKVTAYDAMGGATELTITFTKFANKKWDYATTRLVGGVPTAVGGTGRIQFTDTGLFSSVTANGSDAGTPTAISFTPDNGAATVTCTPTFTLATQLATDTSTVVARDQDGAKAGSLETFTVDSNGLIVGNYTNGTTQNIGQVALASFTNAQGLNKVEGGLFIDSANSGLPTIGTANTGSRGSINASALEQSNVDLGGEFTKMIIAQRAFQANSRIVSAYDEILNEVANMKR